LPSIGDDAANKNGGDDVDDDEDAADDDDKDADDDNGGGDGDSGTSPPPHRVGVAADIHAGRLLTPLPRPGNCFVSLIAATPPAAGRSPTKVSPPIECTAPPISVDLLLLWMFAIVVDVEGVDFDADDGGVVDDADTGPPPHGVDVVVDIQAGK
jgi:hypothetical protein